MSKRVSLTVVVGSLLSLMAVSAIVVLLLTAPDPILIVEAKSMASVPHLAAAVTRRPERRYRKPERIVSGWEEYIAQGKDKQGKVAFFRVLILPGDLRWAFASESRITDSAGNTVSLSETLEGEDMRRLLRNASHLICVGAASVEGNLAEEEIRAQSRAWQLAQWMWPEVSGSTKTYTLSLGRYLGACEGCSQRQTSAQRRVVVIAVSASHPGVEVSSALRDALLGNTEFPLELGDYSSFDLRPAVHGSVALN